MTIDVEVAFPFYPDLSGGPLQGGQIYFGQAGQNPQTSPLTVYWDAAGTQPAAQPIGISNGVTTLNGSPARVYIPSTYSRLVLDSSGRTVRYDSNVQAPGSVFSQQGTGAVSRSVQDRLRDTVSVKDFGAKGDGVTDDTAAIQAALNSGASAVYAPVGTYLISSTITVPVNMTLTGQGPGTVFLINAATTAFSKVFGAVSDAAITIADCKIQANVAGVTGIAFTLCRYTTIRNVFFVGCTTSFVIDRGEWHKIKSCFNLGLASPSLKAGQATVWSSVDTDYVYHVDIDGYQSRNIGNGTQANTLYIRRAIASQFRAVDCNDLNVGNASRQTFILVENDCQGLKFSECIGAAAYAGYLLQRGSGAAVDPSFITLTGCDADQCGTAGFLIAGGNFISIEGCCITASGVATTAQAILMQPGGASTVTQISIANSVLQGYSGSNGTGLQIVGCSYVTVRSNKFDSNNICVGIGGTSTYIDVSGNTMSNFVSAFGGAFSQTGNRAVDNPGYNPVGDGAIVVGASPFTYTAGISPETVYIWGGAVSSVTFGGALTNVASTTLPISIQLGPRESVKVTYSSMPNMNKMVH